MSSQVASDEAGTTARHLPTIRSRIIALVAMIVLPMIGVFAWLASQHAILQRRIIEVQRLDVVSSLTFLVDREVASITGGLNGLAGSDDLISGDFASFRRQTAGLVVQPRVEAIEALDAAGRVAFTTRASKTGDVDLPEVRHMVQRVFSGRAVVSNVYGADDPSKSKFFVLVPVYKDGKVIYALAAAIHLRHLAHIFTEAGLQPSWIAAVVDRNGHFVARSSNAGAYLGRAAQPELAQVARGAPEGGEFNNTTHEGVAVTNAYRRSAVTGWTTVVAVPNHVLTDPLRRSMMIVLLGGGLALFSSIGLATMMARRIADPVHSLSEAAVALTEGRALPETQYEIAELDEVQRAFRHAGSKSAHLSAIVASSGDAITSVRLDGTVMSWNHGAERLFGYSAEEMIGQGKQMIVPEERIAELDAHLEMVRSGRSARTESMRRRRDGSLVHVTLDVAPIRGPDGRIFAMSTIAHDITDRKAAEDHQIELVRELTHRSKNLLAIVQAMARQTAQNAGTVEDYMRLFVQRLRGLAASHDSLVAQNWAGAPLADLVQRQLEIFIGENEERLNVTGPDVYVTAKAAQAIGLALHELSTNSVKYGALSTPAGRINVGWRLTTNGSSDRQLELTWEEAGGPLVRPPTRKGFGHLVLERIAADALDGRVSLDFAPSGARCTITFPGATNLATPLNRSDGAPDRPSAS